MVGGPIRRLADGLTPLGDDAIRPIVEVLDVLAEDRVAIAAVDEAPVADKTTALRRIAELLARGDVEASAAAIESCLREREALQSTGVGNGVAVPHAVMASARRPIGAILLCREAIPFEAIDGAPVHVLIALLSPAGAPANHLRILARLSRVFRSPTLRGRMLGAATGGEAYAMLREEVRGAA